MAQEYTQQYGQRDEAEEGIISQVVGQFQFLGDDVDTHDCDFAAPQQPRRFNPAMRSTPIAIARDYGGQQDRHPDTSDDDYSVADDSVTDVELDALRIADGSTSHSLPIRLLRAPKLGSVPSNEDYISYHNMLPPPMVLSEQPAAGGQVNADQGTSYGSLRDSHERGRFLDGPSSYRDKKTGDIRSTQHRVRFRDNTTISASAPSHSMSIGERIMRSRKLQAQNGEDKSSEERTSSLSAMLQATDDAPTFAPGLAGLSARASAANASANQKSVAFYNDDSEDRMSSNMLSTSLTGLEVLERATRFDSVQEGASDSDSEGSAELPRDSNNHNALLSRSLSDTVPRFGRLNVGAGTEPATSGMASLFSHSEIPPPSTVSQLMHMDASSAASINTAIYQVGFEQTGAGLAEPEPLDENPDIEGAFDMDE
jgi:hypothetical protein